MVTQEYLPAADAGRLREVVAQANYLATRLSQAG
jgi:hypothetical protein